VWCSSCGDDQPYVRLAAEERRAVQRERDRDRELRSLQVAERRRVVCRDDGGERSQVPAAGIRDELSLQEGSGRLQVESHSLQGELTMKKLYFAFAVLALAARPASAQIDLS